MKKEPKQLNQGKIYHKKIQGNWKTGAEGIVITEKEIKKPGGRKGRIDIHVESDGNLIAVVEIKNSNWDKMTIEATKRNVYRQIRQIWDYINSQLEIKNDVSPGIIFPKKPNSNYQLELIEKLFEEQGISVVWENESIDEKKKRSQTTPGIIIGVIISSL